ncbi:MAG: T9SS type A sorting domain-containing protein [Bacteroidota bacterium]
MRVWPALLACLALLPSAYAQDCTATSEISQRTRNAFASLTADVGIGQSFVAPCTGVLQGIEVRVQSVDDGPLTGTLRILSANGSGPTIATAPYSLAETGFQRIPVPSLVMLDANQPYTLFLDPPTSGTGSISGFNGDPYPGGNAFTGPNASTLTAFGVDLAFAVDLGPTTVPPTEATSAYVWADDAAADSYTPNATFSYSASGEDITITRSEVGTYSIDFAQLEGSLGGGNVQVTAYGSSTAHCQVLRWSTTTVDVRCTTPTGQPVDAQYTVLVTWPDTDATVSGLAFAWVDTPTQSTSVADDPYSYTPTGDPGVIDRFEKGLHRVRFTGTSGALGGGHVQVTTYGEAGGRCQVDSWGGETLDAFVRCFDLDGQPEDLQFSILALWPSDAGLDGLAYALGDDKETANYTPNGLYSYTPTAGPVVATRSDVGVYAMAFSEFEGLDEAPGGNVQVSALGAEAAHCGVIGWDSGTAPFQATVQCTNAEGQPVDSQYTLLATWPTRLLVAHEAPQLERLSSLESYPNPSTSQTTVRYTLDSPAHVELAVFDALGRQLDVLVDAQSAAGTHTVTIDASALPKGVYLLRMRAGATVTSHKLTVVH